MPVDINKVSMDYFFRGVQAAKPQGGQPAGAPAQGGANIHAPQVPGGAAQLITQLDLLLLKAAKASAISVDGAMIQDAFQKLVDDGDMTPQSLQLLQETADTAATKFKALDRFTGRELATVFDANGHFNATSTKAGKAVAAAIKAQQDLADLLAQFGKILDAIDRQRVKNRAPMLVNAAARNKVNDLRQLCDRRILEINLLTIQMKDFAKHLASLGRNADPNVVAILKAKANELLPRQALAMHGTADAFSTINETVTAKFRALAARIDSFRSTPATSLRTEEFTTLQSEIRTLKTTVQDIRLNGVRDSEGGKMVVAKDIVEALEKALAEVGQRFESARREVMQQACSNHLETAKSLLLLEENYERSCTFGNETHAAVLQRRDETLLSMQNLYDAAIDPAKTFEELEPLFNDLSTKSTQLLVASIKADDLLGQSKARFNTMVKRCRGIASVVIEFCRTIRRMHGSDRFFTGAEALGVFNGTISISSLVEARAHGLRDEDVDPANEDANIASERQLGAGVAGTVLELTRHDGTGVLFKGEMESRTGLAYIAAGTANNYDDTQQTINLNFATKKAAEALGLARMVVNYSAGTHKGVFGFFMEKAKGLSGMDFSKGKSSSAPDAGLSARAIRQLPPEQQRQIKADIMRELNRLQWLDLVTGQADRHWANYFIHVDRNTHKVTVKGIDNDAGFSQYRTGAVKFTFDDIGTKLFKTQLKKLAGQIDSRNVDAVYMRLLNDEGITTDDHGNITVDATRLQEKTIGAFLMQETGTQSLAVPDKIDITTYNALMALKQGQARDAYLNSIRPRHSRASYNAAVSRLDDVIAFAEELHRQNKVIAENAWPAAQEVPLETGRVSVRKLNNQPKRLGGELAKNCHVGFCPSYFARDGFDKHFRHLPPNP